MLSHVRAFWTFTLKMSKTVWVKSKILKALQDCVPKKQKVLEDCQNCC